MSQQELDVYGLDSSMLNAVVHMTNGKVPAELAARMMNHIAYSAEPNAKGEITFDAIEREMDARGIDLEMRLNMAEALIKDPRNGQDGMRQEALLILGQTFGVNDAMDKLAYAQVASYESPENTAQLEAAWGGHNGRSYEQTKQVLSTLSVAEKKEFLTFEHQQYAKHLGVEASELVFYEGPENSKGWQNAGQKQIGININTPEFASNTMMTAGTVRHENNHAFQHKMANLHDSGALQHAPKDIQLLGQLYSVGLKSYVSPEQGFGLYANQAVEVDSKAVNKYTAMFTSYKANGNQMMAQAEELKQPMMTVTHRRSKAPGFAA